MKNVLSFAVVAGVLGAWAVQGPVAKVERYHGSPAIMVDGKPLPPMSITLNDDAYDYKACPAYLNRLGKAGLKLFYVYCKTNWLQPGDPQKGKPDGVTELVGYLKTLYREVPDAYVMLRFNVSPSVAWVNAHPEEQVVYSDGKPRRTLCWSVNPTMKADGMHSMCSQAWRRDGAKAIEDFLAEMERHEEFARVIGFFLCAGGTAEWYYPTSDGGGRMTLSDGCYGDFSEPFRAEFERYLRGRYGTEEALRRAWRMPNATFAKPVIPETRLRGYVYGCNRVKTDAWKNSLAGRDCTGFATDLDSPDVLRLGMFLNAAAHQNVADYYQALHESTANTVVHFAKTLKRLKPNMLVGAFYGAYGCQDYFDSGTSTGTLTVLDSGAVDFLAAPGTYNNREPGGITAQREMQDSFRIRNCMYICEDDARTHLIVRWPERAESFLNTLQDSVDALKRDFARNVCEDIHGWWFDMAGDPDKSYDHFWYDDPGILALFAEQQKIAAEAYALDRTKRNEIALVYDTESLHYVAQELSELVLDFYRTSDLGRIGAPVDYYFHNDLADSRMPDYRLYVMLNQYCLTEAERAAVYAKARKNGAVVLWLYAPGFVDPEAERRMSAANVSRTVGMNVVVTDREMSPRFRVDPSSHPILAGTSASRTYGVQDRLIHSNVWRVDERKYIPFVSPGFYVEDPRATVLGRYCHNDRAAMAMVETNGVRSVFCAAPIVRSDLLASVAKYAGCHIFNDRDDVLFANENYVAVHAKDDGRRVISFKRRCSPYEVYEKKYYGKDVDRIEVEMRLGQTLMWRLDR